MYRKALDPLVGERLDAIDLLDPEYLRPRGVDTSALEALTGLSLGHATRIGKLLLLELVPDATDTDCEPGAGSTLGLRFGMTGRLLVGGEAPIERLEYSSDRNDPSWDRVRLRFGPRLVAVRDPRRLGSVEVAPDADALGPDAASISLRELRTALTGRRAGLKSVLLNQHAIAGLGNLLADEVLLDAGLAPSRVAGALTDDEVRVLHRAVRRTIRVLTRRGGSHTGPLFVERHHGGVCPRDGTPLLHAPHGGRSTWWCPVHQR